IAELVEWAGEQFALDYPDPVTGVSLRRQLEQVERTTGQRPPQLATDRPPPIGFGPLWDSFLELNRGRIGEPLSWAELDAYARLQGVRFTRVELQALRALDTAFLRHYAARLREARTHG
ncbi:MAG: hypothetical protein H6826_13530, partial [Planctomycetes bacterium]|nr:hypothetical protein [Planctomycetota bacterium]